MTHEPSNSSRAEEAITLDRAAFARQTEKDLPHLVDVARAVRQRPSTPWETLVMKQFRLHPFAMPALLTLAVCAALLLLPFSFDRTVGHEVSLTLTGVAPDPARFQALATEMKSQLGAESVEIRAENENGAIVCTFAAYVPGKSAAAVSGILGAFEKTLEEKGLQVATTSTPRVERVSSTMAAYAADQVIHIQSEGKTAAQLESEIRNSLAAAGFDHVDVSVTDRPEGGREVRIEANRESDDPNAMIEGDGPEIVIDGAHGTAEQARIAIRNVRETPGGPMTLKADVSAHGNTAVVTVEGSDTMSDAALEAEIERQLSAAGVDMDVTVTNGKIEVKARN